MRLAADLLRLCLDGTLEALAGTLDDEASETAWELACMLNDQAELAEARQAAWDATVFCCGLLIRLRDEHPGAIDVDEIVAEWGQRLAGEVRP